MRIQKILLAVFVVGAIGLLAPRTAFSYGALGYAWPGSPPVITYSYVNMFDGGMLMPDGTPLPNSIIKGSIEEALHLWTTVAPIDFVEVPDSVSSDVRFRHIYINGPDPPPPADPVAKAQSTCIGYGFAFCEVQYDDSDRWQVVGTQPQPDVLGASIHEIGHILGLNHTDVVGADMYWIFNRYSGLGTGKLTPDDVAAIQALYGAGSGSLTTLAVPEPSAIGLLFCTVAGWFVRRRSR